MRIVLSDSFFPLLAVKKRYLVLCGGRGSGKTEFAARKVFFRCQTEGRHRFLILRKVRTRCRESVIEVFLRILNENGISYEYNRTERAIRWSAPNGAMNEALFDGLDDPQKIKSIKGITGIWIEEATEFTKKDFMIVDLCLREMGPGYLQIMLSFNPDEAEAPWLKEMFFDRIDPDACVHNSTIDDNPIEDMREAYRKELDGLADLDPTYYKIYRMGLWALRRGRIFNWDVVLMPDKKFDEHFYGGDFGYSVDEAAVVKIYRKAQEFWLEEIIYEKELTNQDLGEKMKHDERVDVEEPSYWDSAEPKSIEELHRMGINAHPSEKGPGSVKFGIDFLKKLKIHIISGSNNIVKECKNYKLREDKHGNPLPEPVAFMDHAMKAVTYGIVTHMRQDVGEAMGTSESSVYPD